MLSILSTRRFARWTALFKTWLKQQLDAIAESIDFGPVEEKIDEVKTAVDEQQLTPIAKIDGNNLIFHYVTLAQMEKMHVDVAGTAAGTIGFVLTKGEENFELRFSDDSPQDFAGNLVVDDSIDIVDYIFELLIVEIIDGYDVQWVRIDGVEANLLEADINWRLADLQQKAANLDNVAKQGTNPNATLSEVQTLIGYTIQEIDGV